MKLGDFTIQEGALILKFHGEMFETAALAYDVNDYKIKGHSNLENAIEDGKAQECEFEIYKIQESKPVKIYKWSPRETL